MKKPEWVYIGPHHIALPDSDGKILANVFARGFSGPWAFKDAEYVSIEAAKRAAEKSLGIAQKLE